MKTKAKKLELSPKTCDKLEWVSPDALDLDADNPRLKQYNLAPGAGQAEILKLLWQRMDVDEVAMSIATDGFWDHEPLFIANENGRDVVFEGNRRLAAVKLLRDPKLRAKLKASDLPEPTEAVLATLEKLPVIRVGRRQDVWRYIGFKHVNGPAKWRSYPKAQYIAFVRKATGASLEQIAEQIGDRHRTVQRLYRALMVIEQAEHAGIYKREFSHANQLYFSHLMTALDYEGFDQFLNLSEKEAETENPVDPKRIENLGEVCRWLWGDRRDNTAPVIESQNPHLRMLDKVLMSDAGLRSLRRGESLTAAFESSKGDDIVFSEALQDAKDALHKAQARVSTGFRGEPHLLDQATSIAEMAADLAEAMHRKTTPIRFRRVRKAEEQG